MYTVIPPEHLTYGTFNAMVVRLRPGQPLLYHTGFILHDVGHGESEPQKRLKGLRKAAYEASERGEVFLVQRRRGIGEFDYLAIKAMKKRPHAEP